MQIFEPLCRQRKIHPIKKYLTTKEQPEIEAGKIEPLKKAIVGLQEQLAEQRLITNTISEENVRDSEQSFQF